MRWASAQIVYIVLAGCGVAPQPESYRTVAAYEVPLPLQEDREAFLSILRAAATVEGLHVDSARSEDLQSEAKAIPLAESTLRATVWRGKDDNEPIASAMDGSDHLGKVWVTFSKGTDQALNVRLQQRAMSQIKERWPSTLSLPIMPTGAIPLPRDLIRTSTGYIVDPKQASRYELKTTNN